MGTLALPTRVSNTRDEFGPRGTLSNEGRILRWCLVRADLLLLFFVLLLLLPSCLLFFFFFLFFFHVLLLFFFFSSS